MSTAHNYGDPPDTICSEPSPLGYGFAPFVGKVWEREFECAALPAQCRVILRTSSHGIAAQETVRSIVYCLWLASDWGTVGTGKQGMSWFHETDLNRLFKYACGPTHGMYIASSPNPVSQKEFMKILRQVVRMP